MIETAEGPVPALALAPVAVVPDRQSRGIGSALITEGLTRCQRRGHCIVIVIGHPRYYTRFAFSSAREKGLEAPFPVPDEAFYVRELVPCALEVVRGMVRHPPAFDRF